MEQTKNKIINVYEILGLTQDVCKNEDCDRIIKKKYNKKAKLCHPDKHPGKEDVAKLFELLTTAYNIIKDAESRKLYNKKLEYSKQSENDYFSLKNGLNKFIESQENDAPTDNNAKLSFAEKMKILDEKHGYDRSQDTVIPEKMSEKKMTKIIKSRAIQDVEYKPEKIFNEHLDYQKFNAAFDLIHTAENTSIVEHNGDPLAWNDTTANYSNINNLEAVYLDSDKPTFGGNDSYSAVEYKQPKKLSKNDIDQITGVKYFTDHKVLDDDYYQTLKSKLNDRKNATDNCNKMKMSDFKRDDTAGYGIYDKLGLGQLVDDEIEINNNIHLLYNKKH